MNDYLDHKWIANFLVRVKLAVYFMMHNLVFNKMF
jgi:hypothetical protein